MCRQRARAKNQTDVSSFDSNRMDTIVAIATGPGAGGIGIVRLSGEQAFQIGATLFKGKQSFSSMSANVLFHGTVVKAGEALDEAMFVKMRAPKSFTKEDVLEIHCHGGRVALGQILDLVCSLGARLAEPGEFTRRAFLNGRIDLSQAEAVIDLINAKTAEGAHTALKQLEGRLSEQVGLAKKELITIIAHLEASVDYPEYEIEALTVERLSHGIEAASTIVAALLHGYDRGRLLREGVTVAITGRPNVGKSSLLNRLAGRQRAIVTEIPGTTRDIIDEYIDLNGIPVRIVDTAGIRETQEPIEKIGVDLALKEVADADLVVVLLDAESGILPEERERIATLQLVKKTLVVFNKIDKETERHQDDTILRVSLLEDTGVEKLIEALGNLVAGAFDGTAGTALQGDVLVTNARHKQLLDQCQQSLANARAALSSGVPLDCLSVDLMAAVGSLAEITGDSVSESIVNEIFSRFCIGK